MVTLASLGWLEDQISFSVNFLGNILEEQTTSNRSLSSVFTPNLHLDRSEQWLAYYKHSKMPAIIIVIITFDVTRQAK